MRKIIRGLLVLWLAWVLGLYMVNSGVSDAYHLMPQDPRWSPDGSKLVFWSVLGLDIWIINSDGTGLTIVDNTGSFSMFPEWSPNGQFIATASNLYSLSDIVLLDISNNTVSNITNGIEFPVGIFKWSTTNTIAFTTYQEINNQREDSLWIRNTNGEFIDLTPFQGIQILSLSWSSDGTKLAYTGIYNETQNIYITDVESGTFEKLTPESYWLPTWLPNSNALIVLNQCENRGQEIVQIDMETYIASNLMDKDICNSAPLPVMVSPTGNQVLYLIQSVDAEKIFDIAIIDISTLDISIITSDIKGDIYDPVWSPDGQKIAFVNTYNGISNLWTIKTDGTLLINLTNQ